MKDSTQILLKLKKMELSIEKHPEQMVVPHRLKKKYLICVYMRNVKYEKCAPRGTSIDIHENTCPKAQVVQQRRKLAERLV